MPEEPEIETNELRESVHAAHAGHDAQGDTPGWIRSVSLSTAILAVFAAVGALQAGSLVNEAMMSQIKSSDTWNEYQASRQKSHMYTIGRNTVLDLSPSQLGGSMAMESGLVKRAREYNAQISKEEGKAKELSAKAKGLEAESEHKMHRHERFAYEVAMMQVAIALGAVSALTKVKSVWLLSMALGAVGIVLFVLGFVR